MFQELLDNITNIDVLTGSLKEWISNLSINSVIMGLGCGSLEPVDE